MIRGVSRYSVEIKGTGSPYFESAICFVKPQYAKTERLDLHRAALELVDRLNSEVEPALEEADAPQERKPTALQRLQVALPLVVSGLTGAAAAFLLCLLI